MPFPAPGPPSTNITVVSSAENVGVFLGGAEIGGLGAGAARAGAAGAAGIVGILVALAISPYYYCRLMMMLVVVVALFVVVVAVRGVRVMLDRDNDC